MIESSLSHLHRGMGSRTDRDEIVRSVSSCQIAAEIARLTDIIDCTPDGLQPATQDPHALSDTGAVKGVDGSSQPVSSSSDAHVDGQVLVGGYVHQKEDR